MVAPIVHLTVELSSISRSCEQALRPRSAIGARAHASARARWPFPTPIRDGLHAPIRSGHSIVNNAPPPAHGPIACEGASLLRPSFLSIPARFARSCAGAVDSTRRLAGSRQIASRNYSHQATPRPLLNGSGLLRACRMKSCLEQTRTILAATAYLNNTHTRKRIAAEYSCVIGQW